LGIPHDGFVIGGVVADPNRAKRLDPVPSPSSALTPIPLGCKGYEKSRTVIVIQKGAARML
jgi:hypothetical protein